MGPELGLVSHLPLFIFPNFVPSHPNSFFKTLQLTHIQASAYPAESVLQSQLIVNQDSEAVSPRSDLQSFFSSTICDSRVHLLLYICFYDKIAKKYRTI